MGIELTHSQSVNRLKDIADEIDRLRNKESLTPEDEQRFAELDVEFGEVDEHRKQLERTAAAARIKAVVQEGLNGVTPGDTRLERGTPGDGYDRDAILEPDSIEDCRFRNPWDLSEMRTYGRSPDEVSAELRARALSAIEKMPSANDKVRSAGTEILERWDDKSSSIAKLVLAGSSPTYLRAWSKMATNRSHELSEDEKRSVEQVRAMSLTDTQGGHLVPFQLDPTVIITANGSQNDIRRAARQVVATGDEWNGVSAGAVQWRWAAEGSEAGDNAPTFDQPAIPIHKADGFVPISLEALQDAANAAATVAELLAFGRDVLEASAFITGSGVGQPTGLVTALTGTSSVLTSASADTFALADVYAQHGALPSRYRRAAQWLANVLIYNRIRQFDTAGGAALWARLGEGLPEGLLGRGVLEAEDMDGTITATAENYVSVFGDFSNYVIADRIGMTVEFIPHLFGANRRPTGQRGWYAYYRVGADSVNDAAFRMLNVT
jgi:HK97 family phage major capsid protein